MMFFVISAIRTVTVGLIVFGALRKPQLKESIKPTGLTSNRPFSHKVSVKNNVVVEVTKSQPDSVMEIYEPFISEGMVSLMDDSTKPIHIKRHRCFSEYRIG